MTIEFVDNCWIQIYRGKEKILEQTYKKGDEFGTVESVKAVSELYMPISGEITSVNKTLEDSPDLVNIQPYHDGWMIEAKPTHPNELETLMTQTDYLKMLKETG